MKRTNYFLEFLLESDEDFQPFEIESPEIEKP
jgi:hypothetical protein